MGVLDIDAGSYGRKVKVYTSSTGFPILGNLDGDLALATDTDTLYVWQSGSTSWLPVATPGAAISITGLNGDVSATGPGAVTATVNTVGGQSAASIAASVTDVRAVSLGGTGSSSFTAGSIPFSNGTILTQDNTNLFWDNTNKRLGVGINSPAFELDVSGQLRLVSRLGQLAGFGVYNNDWVAATTGTALGMGTLTATGDTSCYFQAFNAGASANGPFLLNPYGGPVGVGTLSPLSTLHTSRTFASAYNSYTDLLAAASDFGSIFVEQNYTYATIATSALRGNVFKTKIATGSNPGTKTIVGNYFETGTVSGDATAYSTAVFRSTNQLAIHNGTGNLSRLEAVQAGVQNRGGSGTLTSAVAVGTTIVNTAGSTINSVYGVSIGGITAGGGTFTNVGTIANTYGLYIGTLTGGTQTNAAYSIYSSDASARMYHAGTISIGVTTTATNTKLEFKDGHLKSSQTTAPTVAASANAGTGASATLANATDTAGVINITMGTASWATGAQLTVTFNKAYNVAPIISLDPSNEAAAGAIQSHRTYITSSTTGFSVNFGIAENVPSEVYSWHYIVIETQ